jgi:hypothetical protein
VTQKSSDGEWGTRDARDRERRETVQRYHELKDGSEKFDEAMATTTDESQKATLMEAFEADRRTRREEHVRRGKRPAGGGIMLQQVMWIRWIEVAVEQERHAWEAHARIRAGDVQFLTNELRHSLVAISAAASSIEALVEDVRYLVPEIPRRSKATAARRNARVLRDAFGPDDRRVNALASDLWWLFDRRNEGVHPYSELREPQLHPAGVSTGAEAAAFNAVESGRAVDIAVDVLSLAARPPRPANGWVSRWVVERAPYQEAVVDLVRQRPPWD